MTEIGFFLSGEELSATNIVHYAKVGEERGLRNLWVSDHFHPWLESQGESPFVWSVLGAIASSTGLNMTTAVTCPTYRIHPAIIAQAAATIAQMAPGRFTLGVGSGEALNEHIFGDHWPPAEIRQERLEEAIGLIRRLWTGELVTHERKHFDVHAARLFTLPEQAPEILVSAFGPKAAELAARAGDGLIAVKPDADLVKAYRDAGGTGRIQGGLKICWAESEKEAAETAHTYWGHEAIQGQITTELPLWTVFQEVADASGPEDMAKSLPCGPDAARAAQAIKDYVDAGFDEVYVSQMGPDQEGGLRFLAEEVLPLV